MARVMSSHERDQASRLANSASISGARRAEVRSSGQEAQPPDRVVDHLLAVPRELEAAELARAELGAGGR